MNTLQNNWLGTKNMRRLTFAVVLMGMLSTWIIYATPIPEPCTPSYEDECIREGSVELVQPTSEPVVCIGGSVKVTAGKTIVKNHIKHTTYYDGPCDDDISYEDIDPKYLATWVATIGNQVTNGTGFSVEFTPTNCGKGTVVFSLNYTNVAPCTNEGAATQVSGDFYVVNLSVWNTQHTNKLYAFCNEPGSSITLHSSVCPSGGVYQWSTTSGNIRLVGSTTGADVVVEAVGPSSTKNSEIIKLEYSMDGIKKCNDLYVLTVLKPTSLVGPTLTSRSQVQSRFDNHYKYKLTDQFGDAMPNIYISEELQPSSSNCSVTGMGAAIRDRVTNSNGEFEDVVGATFMTFNCKLIQKITARSGLFNPSTGCLVRINCLDFLQYDVTISPNSDCNN